MVMRSGREADHSPSCSAEVKNEWRYKSLSTYDFMACRGTISYFYLRFIIARYLWQRRFILSSAWLPNFLPM
jgi:hypothetical protein